MGLRVCCVVHRTAGVSVGRGVSGHVMLGLLGGTTRAGVGVGWGSHNYLGRLVGSGAGPEGPVVHHSRGALVGLG